jgi:ubiquinone/menaquinone biosynthesis C-methylase UbiE
VQYSEVMSEGEWWHGFFNAENWQEVHPQFWTAEQTSEQVDLVERLLGIEPGDRVLDVPCGEGRMAIELAARGYRVTGVDITAGLLSQAEARGRERGLNITWQQADMRDLQWRDEFDAVLNWWGSFGYFDDAGNQRFLEAVARALKPGGRVLFDTHVMETLLPQFQPRGWDRVGDVVILQERAINLEEGRIEAEWTYLTGGEVATTHSSIRLYTFGQLHRMLKDAGFTEIEGFDESTGEPLRVGSRRLVMVARKK